MRSLNHYVILDHFNAILVFHYSPDCRNVLIYVSVLVLPITSVMNTMIFRKFRLELWRYVHIL